MGGSSGLEDVTATVGDSEGPGTCALYLAAGLAAGVLCRGTEEWSILAGPVLIGLRVMPVVDGWSGRGRPTIIFWAGSALRDSY
jgi:hypothetical protein